MKQMEDLKHEKTFWKLKKKKKTLKFKYSLDQFKNNHYKE